MFACTYSVTLTTDDAPGPLSAWFNDIKICKPEHVVTIGVVDSGFGYQGRGDGSHLCPYGHRDFTIDQDFSTFPNVKEEVPIDEAMGHGTGVVGIIDKYAKQSSIKYCIIILKFYSMNNIYKSQNSINELEAIRYATKHHIDILNLSEGSSMDFPEERNTVKKYLDEGGIVIAAVGNEHVDLDQIPFYPAMDDPRIVTVGALAKDGEGMWVNSLRHTGSNYGEAVRIWEIGENVTGNGITYDGTSQATATVTGKSVARLKKICYNRRVKATLAQDEPNPVHRRNDGISRNLTGIEISQALRRRESRFRSH
jgi:subtilisin family serine protease